MTDIFLDYSLSFLEQKQLIEEFPKYNFFFDSGKNISPEAEVFFGEHPPEASQLKWIHSPSSSLKGLPLAFFKKNAILLTLSKEENNQQMAEFVLGAILLFAKHFFHWQTIAKDPIDFFDSPLKKTMWTLSEKVILQIGLGAVGTRILQQAEFLGMKTWGIKKAGGFHPYCKKTFDLAQLHSILPSVDILSISQPKTKKNLISHRELRLLPSDSILICVGSSCIDEQALIEIGYTGKFRGIVLDCFQQLPLQKDSPLWKMPNTLITPLTASYPLVENRALFLEFRKKLRLYAAGKFSAMLPVEIDKTLLNENEEYE